MAVKNLRVSNLLSFTAGGSPATPTLGAYTEHEMSFLDKLFQITISGTAEVDIEGSIDAENWTVIQTVSVSDAFSNQKGYKWVRANLKSYSSGDIAVKVSQSEITGGVSPTINVTAATFYTVGGSAPSSPSDGDVWYDTSANEYKVYDSGTWYTLGREIDTVLKDLFDANTILSANSDNTPVALTVAASTIVGRGAAGNIDALTASETKTILAIDHTSDVSNVGTNTHAQIDTHIGTASLHFTEGSIDHGSIAGLGDDDHTQYALADGSRAFSGPPQLPSATVANLTGSPQNPKASPAGQMVYCSDETGGATIAFSDGTDWRRVTDNAVVS